MREKKGRRVIKKSQTDDESYFQRWRSFIKSILRGDGGTTGRRKRKKSLTPGAVTNGADRERACPKRKEVNSETRDVGGSAGKKKKEVSGPKNAENSTLRPGLGVPGA